jgi:hypothetical protein
MEEAETIKFSFFFCGVINLFLIEVKANWVVLKCNSWTGYKKYQSNILKKVLYFALKAFNIKL